ncbi:MAG: hypothetical protein ACI84C_000496 [Flavobacteriales bacterium]|jgi:hypothetical protein
MKNLFTLLFLGLTGVVAAQSPFLNLVTEQVTIDEPALTTITNELGATPSTYRVYAEIPANYEMQIIYGDFLTAMSFSSPTQFYQNTNGGPTAVNINSGQVAIIPELGYDSWITIGLDNSAGNILTVFPDVLPFANWESGGDLLFNDIVGGGVLMPTAGGIPQNTIDADGRILVAQFTSDGTVAACFNFQIRRLNPDGTIYNPPGAATSETELFGNQCVTLTNIDVAGCAADLDNSGHVATPDLLLLLSNFGCLSGCEIDFNQDGSTGTDDLLFFLSAFDTDC